MLDSVGMLRRGLHDPGEKKGAYVGKHQCRQLLYCDKGFVLSSVRIVDGGANRIRSILLSLVVIVVIVCLFVVVVLEVLTPRRPGFIYVYSECVVQAPNGWALLTCTYALLRRAAMVGVGGGGPAVVLCSPFRGACPQVGSSSRWLDPARALSRGLRVASLGCALSTGQRSWS